VATVLDNGSGTTFLQVLYGQPEELASVGIDTPRYCGSTGDKKLLGSVAGVGSDELAVVRSGSGTVTVAHSYEDFEIDHLADGPQDVLAARETLLNDAPEAFAPVVANVTLAGDGSARSSWRRTNTIARRPSSISAPRARWRY
jgi:hypothetical protein